MRGIACRPDEEDVLAIVALIRGNPEVDDVKQAVKAAGSPLREGEKSPFDQNAPVKEEGLS